MSWLPARLDAGIDLLGEQIDMRADEVAVRLSTMKMATIFGTKVNVISWICVSAWNRAMTMPTTMAVSTAGPAAITIVQIAL